MNRSFVKAIWGNLAMAGAGEVSPVAQDSLEYKASVENDSFLGAIERWACHSEKGAPQESLHVRLLDGSMYHIAENEVSKTVDRIHGLLCGKTIHISGKIDPVARTISISKIKAFGATKGRIVRRYFEGERADLNMETVAGRHIY